MISLDRAPRVYGAPFRAGMAALEGEGPWGPEETGTKFIASAFISRNCRWSPFVIAPSLKESRAADAAW